MEKQKLYVVTRRDLPPGDRGTQACHAALAFAFEHAWVALSWHQSSNNLVLLECADEAALLMLKEKIDAAGAPSTLFREPDLGNEATACAFGPSAWRLLSSLPLALKVPKEAA